MIFHPTPKTNTVIQAIYCASRAIRYSAVSSIFMRWSTILKRHKIKYLVLEDILRITQHAEVEREMRSFIGAS